MGTTTDELAREIEAEGETTPEATLDKLQDFAERYEDELDCGDAIVSFLLGRCEHAFLDDNDVCELCGHREPK